ncbi:GCN5 family acetyltransferase [Haematobacter missouriensis]|uniref:N-acetyltransferase n=1 Tax=Haematobacter missouriensis TaxID=366616 RepID=A0A212APV2_9RHOB|nr:N-acetyltransferase [Haematobacter missouriensis]KFI30992.1 GCN5 family acetyltransferase [Haematobacter missouriensis]OWJ73932.1 N-acetyltransferase [Haematobacter missouriensis]OWJ83532.1 N-acetyltransferase [Haematobacter missouriensis]
MTTEFAIRPERPDDVDAIDRLITAAFAGHPQSDGNEARIVRDLRADGVLLSSLVAEDRTPETGGGIIGHLVFSPVTMANGSVWLGLGPISVRPDLQRKGIGTALIRAAFARLDEDAAGYVVVGDAAYYGRFGFVEAPQVTVPGIPPEHVLVRAIWTPPPKGRALYHPAFGLPA